MDATAQLHSFENEKLIKKQKCGHEEDLVSSLPDGVLHHIISFLSTKNAIRTSILSRRWQYLWTSISNLDMDDSNLHSGIKKEDYPMCRAFFLDFVDRVLLLHDASTIKRFRLAFHPFHVDVDSSRVNSWVSAAVKHKVQELDLSLPLTTQFVFPCCLFNCESLVILKVEMQGDLKVPSLIRFPNLRTLELALLTFPDENSIERLFSSCPVLQELSLLECIWNNIKSLTITIPTLNSLIFSKYIPRLVKEDLFSCEIKIRAVNLKYLYCRSNVTVDVLLFDVSSLWGAYIDIRNHRARQREVAHRTVKLLHGILNVKFLYISVSTLSSVSFTENLQDDLRAFRSLTHLKVDSEVSINTFGILMDVLQKLPSLELLYLAEGFDLDFRNERWLLEEVPCCFKSHFKTFILAWLEGTAAEIDLIQFVLKNATVLERMTLSCLDSSFTDAKKLEEISNQIQMLPRGSKSCVIEIL